MSETELYSPFSSMEEGWRGYEAHYVYSEMIAVTQYHCHDYYEIYLHLRGGQFMGMDDKLYLLKPNHLFILPPFTMHGLSCTEDLRGYERCYLNVSAEVMKELGCGQLDLDHHFHAQAAKGLNTFQLSDGDALRLSGWIRRMKENQTRDPNPLTRFEDYTLMMNVMNLICQCIGTTEAEEETTMSNGIIQEVLVYINNHYTQPVRISDLAKHFSVSESYLSHEFSRFTSRSIYEYILYRRVMLARQLMMQDSSLNAIAYQCGFNDYSNFLRSFTKMMGISPSQYRKQLRRYKNVEG